MKIPKDKRCVDCNTILIDFDIYGHLVYEYGHLVYEADLNA